MKVAVVHDYVNQFGGAERVLDALLDIFPAAHIYTLIYSKERTHGRFDEHIFKTSVLDFALARRSHRPFIPLMPLATRSMAIKEGYDLIISDSAGFAKGVPCPLGTFHLSYCYTPLRYAWEIDNYFANPIFKTLFGPVFGYLRAWDHAAAQRPDSFLAVSRFIAGKIAKYYGRESEVVYPPVDYSRFYFDPAWNQPGTRAGYFLAAGRLMHYKKFDLIIDAFIELRLPLIVVGIGPEKDALRRRAAGFENIKFVGSVEDGELRDLYGAAKALIFPQVEDFGLVAAEAQACGCPVIAFRQGGALEIVQEGVTGLFFDSQSPASLVQAVRRLNLMAFDRKKIAALSRRFSVGRFRHGILSHIPQRILACA